MSQNILSREAQSLRARTRCEGANGSCSDCRKMLHNLTETGGPPQIPAQSFPLGIICIVRSKTYPVSTHSYSSFDPRYVRLPCLSRKQSQMQSSQKIGMNTRIAIQHTQHSNIASSHFGINGLNSLEHRISSTSTSTSQFGLEAQSPSPIFKT